MLLLRYLNHSSCRTYCFDGTAARQALLSDDDVIVSETNFWYDGATEHFLQSSASITHQPEHIKSNQIYYTTKRLKTCYKLLTVKRTYNMDNERIKLQKPRALAYTGIHCEQETTTTSMHAPTQSLHYDSSRIKQTFTRISSSCKQPELNASVLKANSNQHRRLS